MNSCHMHYPAHAATLQTSMSQNTDHRTTAWLRLGGIPGGHHLVQPPLPQHRATQTAALDHIQPALEHLQGRSLHNLPE